MEYQRKHQQLILRLNRGEELLSAVRAVCKEEKILSASVVGLGAADYVKLGVYSVSCYKDQFDKLDAAGALELRPDGSAILTDTGCYSEKTGLAMDVETGIGLYF